MRRRIITFSSIALAALASSIAGAQSDWPQILGPNRTGLSTETGLIDTWPTGGPKEVWRVEGGTGMSGLAISRGRLVTMVQTEGQQWVIALDATTGTSIWRTAVAPEYLNGQGKGPRATPTIVGEQVFVFTGEGILAALNFTDGKQGWSHNVVKELGGKPADYGMACSPLVVGDQVIVTAGAPGATVTAYDTASGNLAWKAGDDSAGYSSPALLNLGGRDQIVVFTGRSVLGLAPTKGTVLWRYPYKTDYDCNIATPLAIKDRLFISAGENHGSVLLDLKPTGDTFALSEVWSSQGGGSMLRNAWQTSILIDGHLYGFDNVGSSGPVTHFTCVEAATGKRVWQQLRFGNGNLIGADGKLFVSTMKGELVILRATPKAYDELGRATVIGTTRQAPALAGGLLYLRDDRHIVCLDMNKP
ncbi:MAG: outer membrane protein assembly factor BamB [Kiritimatiellia bacterium]|jgi:outer membrane protein assembly factor BamB